MTTQVIVCPKCGMSSAHPDDIREGYCGNCRETTAGANMTARVAATAAVKLTQAGDLDTAVELIGDLRCADTIIKTIIILCDVALRHHRTPWDQRTPTTWDKPTRLPADIDAKELLDARKHNDQETFLHILATAADPYNLTASLLGMAAESATAGARRNKAPTKIIPVGTAHDHVSKDQK